MDWLKQHWKGTALWVSGIVATVIVERIISSFLDVGIFPKVFSILATPLTLPLWLVAVMGTAILAGLALSARILLDAPKLTDAQRLILVLISTLNQNGRPSGKATIRVLMGGSQLSQLIVEAAVDVLTEKGLIDWNWQFVDEAYATLTARGRAYLLKTWNEPVKTQPKNLR